MKCFVVVAVTMCMAAALATGVSARPTDVPPQPETLRTCGQRLESGGTRKRLAESGDLRIGPVAFTQLARRGFSRRYLVHQGNVYALKTPLIVTAGLAVTLAIGAEARSDASLFWKPGAYPTELSGGLQSVGFRACKRNQRAWSFRDMLGVATYFGGAFLVSRPMCLPIEVWIEGRELPLRRTIPIGVKRC